MESLLFIYFYSLAEASLFDNDGPRRVTVPAQFTIYLLLPKSFIYLSCLLCIDIYYKPKKYPG